MEDDVSSCLYVGDVDISTIARNRLLMSFLINNRNETPLLIMLIPHHGIRYNVRTGFEKDYLAKYYFVNDEDTNRIQKNVAMYGLLAIGKQLLVSRTLPQDIIVSETEIR